MKWFLLVLLLTNDNAQGNKIEFDHFGAQTYVDYDTCNTAATDVAYHVKHQLRERGFHSRRNNSVNVYCLPTPTDSKNKLDMLRETTKFVNEQTETFHLYIARELQKMESEARKKERTGDTS